MSSAHSPRKTSSFQGAKWSSKQFTNELTAEEKVIPLSQRPAMQLEKTLCQKGEAGEVSQTLPESVHVSGLVLPPCSLFGYKTSLCPCIGATYWAHGHLPAPILGKLCQARGYEVRLLLTDCNLTSPRHPPIVLAHLAWLGQRVPVTFGGVGCTLVLCIQLWLCPEGLKS